MIQNTDAGEPAFETPHYKSIQASVFG